MKKLNIQRNFPTDTGGTVPVIVSYQDFFAGCVGERVFPCRMCLKCGTTHPFLDFVWVPGLSYPTDERDLEGLQIISMHDTCCYRHCGQDGQEDQACIHVPEGKDEELSLRFDFTLENGIRYTWFDIRSRRRYAWLKRGTRYTKAVREIRFQPYLKRSGKKK